MSADVVAIIGFGFHGPNLRRILFDELCALPHTTIFATLFDPDEDAVGALANRPSVRKFSLQAHQFVPEFLRRLQAGSLDDWRSGPGFVI
jgi:hypothetical protein